MDRKNSKPFSSPFSRMFPKKIVTYLANEVTKILLDNAKQHYLNPKELTLLVSYQSDLSNKKIYYDKANLDFVRKVYPLILEKKVNPKTIFLYSEILRINPQLITNRLGNEFLINKGIQ